jgi:hypothetical protein
LWRGTDAVRELIVANIRTALDIGALTRAADNLLALRLFLTEFPEAQLTACPCSQHCAQLVYDDASERFTSHCPNLAIVPPERKH